MNENEKTISLICDMLQRAEYRKVRFVYILLLNMLGGEESA